MDDVHDISGSFFALARTTNVFSFFFFVEKFVVHKLSDLCKSFSYNIVWYFFVEFTRGGKRFIVIFEKCYIIEVIVVDKSE